MLIASNKFSSCARGVRRWFMASRRKTSNRLALRLIYVGKAPPIVLLSPRTAGPILGGGVRFEGVVQTERSAMLRDVCLVRSFLYCHAFRHNYPLNPWGWHTVVGPPPLEGKGTTS